MNQSPNDVPEAYAGTGDLPTSDRHKVLASERRRVALDILAERTDPVDLENLASAIAAREADGIEADEETVKRVALTLHHQHLPLMAKFGVIEYDPEATLVEPYPRRPDS